MEGGETEGSESRIGEDGREKESTESGKSKEERRKR